MEVSLDDNGVHEYTQTIIPKPTASSAQALSRWNKYTTIARRIILEVVRDYVVSKLHGKETPFAMWKTHTNLFKSSSDARKLALRNKLKSILMYKNETIPSYLSRFIHVPNEIGGVGENVSSLNLCLYHSLTFQNPIRNIKIQLMEETSYQIRRDFGLI